MAPTQNSSATVDGAGLLDAVQNGKYTCQMEPLQHRSLSTERCIRYALLASEIILVRTDTHIYKRKRTLTHYVNWMGGKLQTDSHIYKLYPYIGVLHKALLQTIIIIIVIHMDLTLAAHSELFCALQCYSLKMLLLCPSILCSSSTI